MAATIFYDDVNEIALLTNTFTLNAVAADPTTVSCVVVEPSGTSVTHTYNGASPADIVKVSTGKYTLSVPCLPSVTGVDGLWSFVFIGTGAVSDVQPGTWRVLPEAVGRFYCGLEELKDRLGITDNVDDSSAQMAIQAASSWINEYCVVPETLVLTADLRWVPAGDLVVGQELVGVDEEPVGQLEAGAGPGQWLQHSNRNRFYRRAEVLAVPRRMAETLRLTLADGREVTSAADHRWLVRRKVAGRAYYRLLPESRSSAYGWMHARDIRAGDEIASPLRVWPEETGFEAGWVSGLLDGEGWLSGQAAVRTNRIGFGQNPGPVLDGLTKYLDNIRIPYTRDDSRTCVNVEIGARWASMEIMGRLRPRRLLPRASALWEGGRVIRNGPNSSRVVGVEAAGVREVVSLGTSTGTYIANGLISHNCGTHFYRVTETRTYQPTNIWSLNIDPLVSVSQLNVDTDGDGTFEQPWTLNTDYALKLGENSYNVNAAGVPRPFRVVQVLQAGKWFPPVWPYAHLDRVQIIGTWGWPAVPPPVSQACLVLAAQWFKEKDAPFGVAGVSDFGVVRVQANPWVVEMLRPYIYSKRKVGV